MVESVKQLGKIGFDLEKGTYWAEVLHLCAAETFYADSVDELRQLMRGSVPDRHEESSTTEASPSNLFYDSLVIDVNPTLFYKLEQQAILQGKSLNQFVLDILQEVIDGSQVLEPI